MAMSSFPSLQSMLAKRRTPQHVQNQDPGQFQEYPQTFYDDKKSGKQRQKAYNDQQSYLNKGMIGGR